jgi:signal peptidase I
MNLSPTDFRDLVADLLGGAHDCQTLVRGKSMRPAIEDGDLVTLRSSSPHELIPGDVLLFVTPEGQPICHRLVRILRRRGQRWVQTWGDASPWPDAPVPVENVLGRVELVRSKNREVAREALSREFQRSLLRRRLCLCVPGLLRARRSRLPEYCVPAEKPHPLER